MRFVLAVFAIVLLASVMGCVLGPMSDPPYAALHPRILNATSEPVTVEYSTHETRERTRATFTLPPGGRFDGGEGGVVASADSNYPTLLLLRQSLPPLQLTFRFRADRWKIVNQSGTLVFEPDMEAAQ